MIILRTFVQKPKATLQTTSSDSALPGRASFKQSREASSSPRLQRTIGSKSVERSLLSEKEDLEATPASNTSAGLGHDFSRIPVFPSELSTTLKVGAPEDKYEREADRVADAVMQKPIPMSEDTTLGKGPNVREERPVKRSGQPLPAATRSAFEDRFGEDFGAVRVHDSEQAHTAATSLGANAFTVRNDITFASGRYDPSTMAGQRLLAHELVHVM